jgi:hypothetical protein
MLNITDEDLLALLQEALTYGPCPPAVVAAAKDAFGWRDIDAQLAALTFDSLLETGELVGVRSATLEARLLTFECGEVTVEIELADGSGGRINGQLVPPQAAEIEVRYAGGSLTITASAAGRFWVTELPRGPISLICRFADGTVVQTEWVVL